MTQISRPFQIALVTMGLIVAVWFVALRGHQANSSGSATPAQAPAASPAAPGAPSSVYHGPAPGVEGLTRAIAKAHTTVAESERAARQLQQKSAQASGGISTGVVSGAATAGQEAATPGTGASTPGTSATGPWTSSWVASHRSAGPGATATHGSAARSLSGIHGSTTSEGLAITQHPAVSRNSAPSLGSAAARRSVGAHGSSATKRSVTEQGTKIGAKPAMQVTVERELTQGRLVAILFWNPSAPVDQQVHQELQSARQQLGGNVVLHIARTSQLASFGSLLRASPVSETPTILLVNKRGRTRSVTGFTDAYSIEQAITEARRA